MKSPDLDRRAFLRTAAAGSLALVPVAALVSCSKKLDCTDMSGLSPDEQNLRKTNEYVDASPNPAKSCENCLQFVAAAPDQCGSCKVLKGPINRLGYCKLWAQK